jgi:hypothetical protein
VGALGVPVVGALGESVDVDAVVVFVVGAVVGGTLVRAAGSLVGVVGGLVGVVGALVGVVGVVVVLVVGVVVGIVGMVRVRGEAEAVVAIVEIVVSMMFEEEVILEGAVDESEVGEILEVVESIEESEVVVEVALVAESVVEALEGTKGGIEGGAVRGEVGAARGEVAALRGEVEERESGGRTLKVVVEVEVDLLVGRGGRGPNGALIVVVWEREGVVMEKRDELRVGGA